MNLILTNESHFKNISPDMQVINASWLRMIYVALEKKQLPAKIIFSEVGIDITSLPSLEFFKRDVLHLLYQKIARYDAIEELPVVIAEIFQLHFFRYEGSLLSEAKSVEDMLAKLVITSTKISQPIEIKIETSANFTHLILGSNNCKIHQTSLEIVICVINKIANQLFPAIFGGIINVILPENSKRSVLENSFQCSIVYDETYALVFDNRLLKTINIFTIDSLTSNELLTSSNSKSELKIYSNIQQLVIDNIAKTDLSIIFVAEKMCMSVKTLQRLLKRFNTNFSELLQISKTNLALFLLNENRFSIQQISYKLGFNSASSFSRSFKKWTGNSPSYYQK